MKLLVINPNISDDVTALIESEARRSASPGTSLVVRTAGHGVEYIETRFESLIAAGAVAEIIAEHTAGAGPRTLIQTPPRWTASWLRLSGTRGCRP